MKCCSNRSSSQLEAAPHDDDGKAGVASDCTAEAAAAAADRGLPCAAGAEDA